MGCWIIVSFFRRSELAKQETTVCLRSSFAQDVSWLRKVKMEATSESYGTYDCIFFCLFSPKANKKKMLTLLTFHKNESCLSLGTAVPAKKLLIRFPFTGETESGLSRDYSHLSDSPFWACPNFEQTEVSQDKAPETEPESPGNPTSHALKHLCQALLPRRWA